MAKLQQVVDLPIFCRSWCVLRKTSKVKRQTYRYSQDVDNVLIVVTRYFGGIHLGPDRFKHINQAARNALEDGGFLDVKHDKKATSRPRKRG